MKAHPNPKDSLRFISPLTRLAKHSAFLLLATLALPAFVHAQTYSLTNVWNITAGTDGLSSGSDGGNRGMAYSALSNQVFVAYRAGSSNLPIMVFDGTAGTFLSGSSGVNGSLGLNCDQIGVGDDGILYGCPLNTGVTGTSAFKIYSWTNWNTAPYLCFSNGASDPLVTAVSGTRRVGDSFAITGAGTNTLILVGVGGTGAFDLLSTTDGVNFTSTILTNSAIGAIANVSGLAFYTNNTFIAKVSSGGVAYLIQFPTNFASLSSPVTATVLGSVSLTGVGSGGTKFSYSSAGKLLAATTELSSTSDPINLYTTTNFPTTASSVASTSFTTTSGNNGNETGGVALGGTGKTNYLYAMSSDNGLHAYQIIFTTAPIAPTITTQPINGIGAYNPQTLFVVETGTAPITNLWYSNTASNTTGGTLVQSGTNTTYTVATPLTNYYYVIATNVAGSATSSVVELALIPATTNSVVTSLFSIAPGTATYPFEANDDNTRGLDYDTNTGNLVIANKNGGAHIYLVNGTTGANIGQISTSGMYAGGTFPIDQVGVADDGKVYAGNLGIAGQQFNLTQFSSATTNATLYNSFNGDPGNDSLADRWGDYMVVRGAGVNTQILLSSRDTNMALLTTVDGSNFTATTIPVPGVPNQFAGYGIAFGAGNTFWAKNYLGNLFEVSFDPTLTSNAAVLLDYVEGTQIPSHMVGVGVDTNHGILGGVILNDQNPDLQLFQLTGNANPPVLFDQAFFPSYNPSANGNDLGVVSMKYPHCYALDVDIGIIGVTYGVPASTPPSINTQPVGGTIYAAGVPFSFSVGVSGTLPLYYQWQFNSVSNLATASNISGATAGSYTLNSPAVSNSGWYDVIVTNFGGATNTTPVELTVLQPVTSTYVTNIWRQPPGASNTYLDSSSYAVRGLAYDTNTATLLLANRVNTTITVLNAADGSLNNSITINTAGLPAGTFTLDQIAVADDGALYGGNLALTPGDTFAITRWSAVSSGAGENAAYSGDPGSGSGDRWGDTMAIRGSGTNTQILLGSYGQGYGPGTNVALLTTADGMTFSALSIAVSNVPDGFSSLGIAFGAGNTFWAKGGHDYDLRQVSFDPTGSNAAIVLEDYSAPTQTPNDLTGLGVDAANNILIGTCFNDTPNDLQFYQLTGTTNSPILYDQAFYGSVNANSQENAVGIIKFPWAFGLDVNNGLVAVQYSVPPTFIGPFSVSVARVGSSVVLSWPSVSGHTYNVLASSSVVPARSTWATNASIAGTGGTLSYTNSSPSGKTFYCIQGQ